MIQSNVERKTSPRNNLTNVFWAKLVQYDLVRDERRRSYSFPALGKMSQSLSRQEKYISASAAPSTASGDQFVRNTTSASLRLQSKSNRQPSGVSRETDLPGCTTIQRRTLANVFKCRAPDDTCRRFSHPPILRVIEYNAARPRQHRGPQTSRP